MPLPRTQARKSGWKEALSSSSYPLNHGWSEQSDPDRQPWRWHAQTAEKYLRKGSKVYIEGKLRSRQYQDKDGQTRYITEVVCDEMNMLDRPTTDGGAGQGAGQAPAHQAGPTSQPVTSSSSAPTDNDTDDLPF